MTAVLTAASFGLLYATAGTALAVPPTFDDCTDLTTAFQNGGEYTLPSNLNVRCSLVLGPGTNLTINLGGHTLAVTGPEGTGGLSSSDPGVNGTPGGNGGIGLDIKAGATLSVNNGTMTVTGGPGGWGGFGAPAYESGNGGMGAAGGSGATGLSNAGTFALQGVALTLTGGDGRPGGSGGDGAGGGEGGVGAAGGNGALALINYGKVLLAASSLSAAGGDGGDVGAAGAGLEGVPYLAGGNGAPAVGNYAPGVIVFDYSGVDGTDGPELTATSGHAGTSSGGASAIVGQPAGIAHRVVLDGNGNSGAGATKVALYANYPVYPAAEMLLPWPSRTGYTFDGWSETAGGEKITPPLDPTDAVSGPYYARWVSDGPETTSTSSGPTTTSTAASSTAPVTSTPVSSTSAPSTSAPSTSTSTAATTSTPVPVALPSSVADTAELGVDDYTPTQGGQITLTARGFQPGSTVDFWMHSTPLYLGSAVADDQGIATLAVKLSAALTALHHVQAVGVGPEGQPRNLAQTITITAPPALAETGPVTWPFLLLALELLAAGAALLRMQQRSRRTTSIGAGSHR